MSLATKLALIAITVLSAALSFHNLGAKPLWGDEGWSLGFAQLAWRDALLLAAFAPVQWPYNFVLRAFLVFGDSEALLRLPSALFMIASVPMMFLAARRLFGATAGLACAALLAVNADIVKYAQEARGYALAVFLLTSSFYFLHLYVSRPSPGRAVLYIGVCVLAVYSHLYGALVVAAQGFSLLLLPAHGFSRKRWLLTYAPMAVLTLPVWWFASRVPREFTIWMTPPTWQEIDAVLRHICGNAGEILVVLCALLSMKVLYEILREWKRGDPSSSWPSLVSLLSFVLPIAITVGVSYAGRPCFWGRYMLVAVPGLVLTTGGAIARLDRTWKIAPVLCVFLMLELAGVRSYYHADFDIDGGVRENYPELARFIAAQAKPGDGIVLYWPAMRINYEYYLRRQAGAATLAVPTVIYPTRARGRENFQLVPIPWFPTDEPNPDLSGYRRVWLVVHRVAIDYRDPTAIQIARAIGSGYPFAGSRIFPTWTVFLYSADPAERLPNDRSTH